MALSIHLIAGFRQSLRQTVHKDKIMSRAKVLILLPCLLSSGSALAEDLEWAVVDMPYLEARSNESEADASLRALCAPGPPGHLELRRARRSGLYG